MQGAGCRVQGAGCRVQGSGFRVQGSGFRVNPNRGCLECSMDRDPPMSSIVSHKLDLSSETQSQPTSSKVFLSVALRLTVSGSSFPKPFTLYPKLLKHQ